MREKEEREKKCGEGKKREVRCVKCPRLRGEHFHSAMQDTITRPRATAERAERRDQEKRERKEEGKSAKIVVRSQSFLSFAGIAQTHRFHADCSVILAIVTSHSREEIPDPNRK
jgi:hypothetical protein